jgi:nucleotidyltransferase substrate binding protein (TIGR01987 family)
MSQSGQKLENLIRALQRLQEAARAAEADDNAIIRDGLIQRFEFTYELAWKALKDYLEQNGIVDKYSPKGVFKEAYAQRLVGNEQT